MAYIKCLRNVISSTIPEGSTATPTDVIQTLLACAGVTDKEYTTLAALLADTTTLATVINSNNAIDYLVRSTTWAGDMCADSSAMSYIGLNNYASNTLLSDSTWKTAICQSAYKESVLNVKVPVMTSDNTPSGECFASSVYSSSYSAWKAFNKVIAADNEWCSQNGTTSNVSIGYKFTNAVKIYAVGIINQLGSSPTNAPKNCKVQCSTDNQTYDDMSTFINTMGASGTENLFVLSDTALADYWRLLCIDNYGDNYIIINELQFYGRADV